MQTDPAELQEAVRRRKEMAQKDFGEVGLAEKSKPTAGTEVSKSMMQKLTYQSPKWEKCKQELIQIGYDFSKELNIDGYIRELKNSKMEAEDYCHFFACISLQYRSWATSLYLNNPHDLRIIDNIYCSGMAGVLSQQLGGLDLPQWKNQFQTALYELAAIGYTDICYLQDNYSALSCMLTENLELAERMLSNIDMDVSPRIGSQYVELKYLKNIYLAIIQGDEFAFNSEIIRRIKTYRKNPYTHAVIIDFPVIALIRIAKKYGISYRENVAEIPTILLNDKITIQTEQLKLPFSDEASCRICYNLDLSQE